MGFLKFLKREKKFDVNELDLPPEPPPLEGFEDTHNIPEFPEIKSPDDFDMSAFDVSVADKTDDTDYEPKMPEIKDMPDYSDFKGMTKQPETPVESETPSKPVAAPAPAVQLLGATEQKEISKSPQQVQRRSIFHHERNVWEKPVKNEVYVSVHKFKAILDGISIIRTSIRKSDEALMRLESIKNSKDRSFDKVKLSLEDLQKKLIFIDKSLFKGD